MVNRRLAGLPYFGVLAQARPGDRETVLGFMYPIYVSAELKTKKIAVASLTSYVEKNTYMYISRFMIFFRLLVSKWREVYSF